MNKTCPRNSAEQRMIVHAQACERRGRREKYRKRKNTFFRNGKSLGVDFTELHVYQLLEMNGKLSEFKTTKRKGWPPSQEEIDKRIDPRDRKTSDDVKLKGDNIVNQQITRREIHIPTLPRPERWPSIDTRKIEN